MTPETLQVEDIIRVTTTKSELEGSLRSLKRRNYTYQGRAYSVDPSNSMMFEFPTLQSQFPQLYASPTYKMLLSLGLSHEERFPPVLLNEIGRVQSKDSIDKIVVWSAADLDDDTIQLLKAVGIDIIHFQIPSLADVTTRLISNFIPLQGKSLEYSLLVNHVSEYLLKRIKQLFHLVLSEISASIFDEHYAKDKAATRAVMRFEEVQLGKLLKKVVAENKTGIAVDVGCGTGRHSFLLARVFSEVYAFDFSPKMIEKAVAKKQEMNDTKIVFSAGDFEYERLADEGKFYGTCDLVVASFGLGSFIEDTVKMLRRFHDWLKPGGYLFVSFYNENSLVSKLTPSWRDVSLTANLDVETQSLKIDLPGDVSFNIFCRPFNDGTRGEINKMFNIDDVFMYPTIMALMPNSLLQDKLAYRLFSYVDDILADNKAMLTRSDEHEHPYIPNNYGYYVIVVARKPIMPTEGYTNIVRLLERRGGVEFEIVEHGPVLSIADVVRELGRDVDPSCLLKTIIFKDARTDEFISVSIPAEKQVDKGLLAGVLGIPRRRIKFASEKEVIELGFPIGGIAPFGFNAGGPIHKIMDEGLRDLDSTWLYMGVGDNRKTLKIQRRAFLDLVADYHWVRF